MNKRYLFYVFQFTLLGLTLPSENLTAQEQSLCVDYSFFPFKKNKKPLDTACTIVENGFMYAKADEIMKLSGVPMNFIVCKTSGVQNAFAFVDKNGNRYIKYDDEFMSRINTDSSADESTIMLAHEIGHHVFFHTILNSSQGFRSDIAQNGKISTTTTTDSAFRQGIQEYYEVRRRQELEADRFAGFIMARKGISFDKGDRFYKKFARYYRDKNDSTHPSIQIRIQALKEGYEYAAILKNQPIDPSMLGKQNTTIFFKKTNKLDRDLILTAITDAINSAQGEFSNKPYPLGYGTGSTSINQLDTIELKALRAYLDRDINPSTEVIDDENDFFQLIVSNFNIRNSSPYTHFSYFSGYHIQAGYFYLILFMPGNGVKVAYRSRFEKEQISLDEIKLLYSQIFKPIVQKLFDNYSQ